MNSESLKIAFAAKPYELLERIGEGGYGEVWSALQRPTEEEEGLPPKTVAIKILKQEGARLGPQLHHKAIVRIFENGDVLGHPYQVMEFFRGQNLRSQMKEISRDLLSLRRVFLPLLEAVEHAHSRAIIHRDIKPENVLVRRTNSRWQVKLTDFGLAREISQTLLMQSATFATGQAAPAGTVSYIAPELHTNPSAFSPRSDIYALGVLLFELLTGRLPVGLELPSELEPKLPRGFDTLTKSMLASNPPKRPNNIAAIRRELLPLLHLPNQPGAPIVLTKARGKTKTKVKREAAISDELDMVLIPACSFVQGNNKDPFARPERLTTLSAFWIDRYPVTNEAYLEFVKATGHTPPKSWQEQSGNWHTTTSFRLTDKEASLPVISVTYQDALAYAEWAGKRLPTEAEWERAAQGPKGWPYPYGEKLSLQCIHHDPDSLSSVDRHYHGRGLEGVFDLTGNAWEWCSDWYDRKAYSNPDAHDPTGPQDGDAKVIRGGYDAQLEGSGSAFFRSFMRPDLAHNRVGFRCAKKA